MALPPRTQINEPILYSDWDAIQTLISEQIGPLQEIAGSPGVYVEGSGYGLGLDQLYSKPYPFTRTVKRISSEAQARIEFIDDHHLVDGEVIFFTNFVTHPNANTTNNWSGYDIANNYAVVLDASVDSRTVIVDFNTFNYSPGDNGAVFWETYVPASNQGHSCDAVQYYVSANQFANLRADLSQAVDHITGAVPGPGNLFPGGEATDLPVPLRNDTIRHSVYDKFYNVVDAASNYQYICAVQQQYQPALGSSARNANAWTGNTFFEFAIDWKDSYDFVQFFNTGGFVEIQFPVADAVVGDSNNNRVNNLNRHWRDLIRSIFPLYIGARSKTNMGLDGDSRSISDVGAFDVSSVDTLIAQALGNTISGYGSSYNDHYVRIYMRELINQTKLNFIVELYDSSSSNAYASDTDVDREIKIVMNYSGGVPLRATPQNYGYQISRAWTS